MPLANTRGFLDAQWCSKFFHSMTSLDVAAIVSTPEYQYISKPHAIVRRRIPKLPPGRGYYHLSEVGSSILARELSSASRYSVIHSAFCWSSGNRGMGRPAWL